MLEARSLRLGCQHGQVLMKSSGLQTGDFLLNLHMAKRQREAFWSDENVLYHRLWCSLNNSMYLLEPVKLEFKAGSFYCL